MWHSLAGRKFYARSKSRSCKPRQSDPPIAPYLGSSLAGKTKWAGVYKIPSLVWQVTSGRDWFDTLTVQRLLVARTSTARWAREWDLCSHCSTSCYHRRVATEWIAWWSLACALQTLSPSSNSSSREGSKADNTDTSSTLQAVEKTVKHSWWCKGMIDILLQLFGGSSGGMESTPYWSPLKSSLAAGTNLFFLSTINRFCSLNVPLDPPDNRFGYARGRESWT